MFTATMIWTAAALLILGAEMLLGTIYLLACFVGACAAVICAYFDAGLTVQIACSGAITFLGGIAAWYFRTHIRKLNGPKRQNSLDLGQRVTVNTVKADGTAKVYYRGTYWEACGNGQGLTPGVYTIEEINGIQLVLGKKIQ